MSGVRERPRRPHPESTPWPESRPGLPCQPGLVPAGRSSPRGHLVLPHPSRSSSTCRVPRRRGATAKHPEQALCSRRLTRPSDSAAPRTSSTAPTAGATRCGAGVGPSRGPVGDCLTARPGPLAARGGASPPRSGGSSATAAGSRRVGRDGRAFSDPIEGWYHDSRVRSEPSRGVYRLTLANPPRTRGHYSPPPGEFTPISPPNRSWRATAPLGSPPRTGG